MSGQPSSSKSPTAAPPPCRYILHGDPTQPSPSGSQPGGQSPGKYAVSTKPSSALASTKLSDVVGPIPSGSARSPQGSHANGLPVSPSLSPESEKPSSSKPIDGPRQPSSA